MGATKADEYYEQEQQMAEAYSNENREHRLGGRMVKRNGDYLLITMYLKAENGEVSGKYFYQGNPKKEDILLKGRIIGDSLMLTEYDAQNKSPAILTAVLLVTIPLRGNGQALTANGVCFLSSFMMIRTMKSEKSLD
jgi:hypothetical protein